MWIHHSHYFFSIYTPAPARSFQTPAETSTETPTGDPARGQDSRAPAPAEGNNFTSAASLNVSKRFILDFSCRYLGKSFERDIPIPIGTDRPVGRTNRDEVLEFSV